MPPGAKSVKALEDQAPPVVNFCVLESAGFELAHRFCRRGAERLRRRRQDVCCDNAFSALASTDLDNDHDHHGDELPQLVDASDEEVQEISKGIENGSNDDQRYPDMVRSPGEYTVRKEDCRFRGQCQQETCGERGKNIEQ